MICYVLIPEDIVEKIDTYSPEECLQKINICETILNRVIPSQERDNRTCNKSNTMQTGT